VRLDIDNSDRFLYRLRNTFPGVVLDARSGLLLSWSGDSGWRRRALLISAIAVPTVVTIRGDGTAVTRSTRVRRSDRHGQHNAIGHTATFCRLQHTHTPHAGALSGLWRRASSAETLRTGRNMPRVVDTRLLANPHLFVLRWFDAACRVFHLPVDNTGLRLYNSHSTNGRARSDTLRRC